MPLDPSRLKLVAGSVWEEGPGKGGRWSTDHAIIFINEDEDGDDEGTIEIQAEDALSLAKLIAAAPEMLTAAKALVDQIEWANAVDDSGHPMSSLKAFHDLRAAIAKASA
jgi:hypothetical protein